MFKKIAVIALTVLCCIGFAACTHSGTYLGSEEDIIAKLPDAYPYADVPFSSPIELVSAKETKIGDSMQYQITYNSSSSYSDTVGFYKTLLPSANVLNMGLATGFTVQNLEKKNITIYVLDSRSSGTQGVCTVDVTVTVMKS